MQRQVSVLHVYRTYYPDPPGGMQEAIRQLCLATKAHGVANTVFTLSPHPDPCELERPEARVVRAKSWIAPASCDIGGMAALDLFRREVARADVVHYLFPWPYGDVLHMVGRVRTPTVVTYVSDVVRQQWLGRAYAPLMRRMLHSARVIVANSPSYARTSPVLSRPELRDKVRVIPFGIVESSYPLGDESVFDRIGLARNEPYFLFVGVLRYYKGLHTLIRAALGVDAPIVIVGTGPEGANLQALATELSACNIRFAGQASDQEKVALIQGCRALVLPSHLRSEAYGMVLIEAGMYGKPQISCEIGTGTSFINLDGESGLVVPPEDERALSEAMNILLGDEALAKRLGCSARNRYERMFSGPALGRAYSDLFREIAK